MELLLSLSLKWADEQLSGNDKLSIAISRITADAARVAGLSAGGLSMGSVADVCVFDADARWLVNAAAIASQGKHTPFLGYELPGQACVLQGSNAINGAASSAIMPAYSE